MLEFDFIDITFTLYHNKRYLGYGSITIYPDEVLLTSSQLVNMIRYNVGGRNKARHMYLIPSSGAFKWAHAHLYDCRRAAKWNLRTGIKTGRYQIGLHSEISLIKIDRNDDFGYPVLEMPNWKAYQQSNLIKHRRLINLMESL